MSETPTLSDAELRERRRAKILASKDARMARITGSLKNDSSASLKVDEATIQEIIAEEKKIAVEVAQADYHKTHREHDMTADEKLTPTQVKEVESMRLKEKLSTLHPPAIEDSLLPVLVILLSSISSAYFFFTRTDSTLKFCLNFSGIMGSVSACRTGLLPVFLQTVPAAFAVSLLPILSDFFKRRKSSQAILFSILPRSILFLVTFLITLRILIH